MSEAGRAARITGVVCRRPRRRQFHGIVAGKASSRVLTDERCTAAGPH